MANRRNDGRKGSSGRDAGGFVALPWSVLDCPAYAGLSHPARALLLEVARQFVRDNNGRLLVSRAYLAKRGWKSADVIDRAKRELLEAGFIYETVKGHRPNKASWYAVTWQALDRNPNFDPGAFEGFSRSAYHRAIPLKNARLSPSRGTEVASIGPSPGTERPSPVPSPGPIRATFGVSPVPSGGHHLDMPSAVLNAATIPTNRAMSRVLG